MMDSWWLDLRYAVRSLARRPALSLAVVATLGIGVGLNGAVLSVVNAYLFKPLPVPEADRLVLLGSTRPELPNPHELSWPDYEDYAALPVFSSAAAWLYQSANLGAAGSRAERVAIGEVTANYFQFLGVPAELGRTFLPGEDRDPGGHRVIVLTHGYWMRHFAGDRGVLGREVPVNGRAATIVGVLPASFRPAQSLLEMSLYMPFNQVGADHTRNYPLRDANFINVAARLAPGVSVAQARAAAQGLAARIARDHPATRRGMGIAVVPERRARPILFLSGFMAPAGLAFVALSLLVLLVASANVAGLLLSRSAARERELAVRAALGAGRARLVRLLLAESVVLGLGGGALALGITVWATGLLTSLRIATDFPIRFDVTPDWRVFAVTLAFALASGMLAGLVPAWRASAARAVALKEGARTTGGTRQRLRAALVVAQVAVAIVVVVVAGTFVRSLQSAARLPLGFDPDGVLLAAVSPGDQGYDTAAARALADRLVERAGALPGVTRAAIARRLPIGYSSSADRIEPLGAMPDGSANMAAWTNVVTPGYLALMGIPLLHGRDFTAADDSTRPRVAVVSESFARRMWATDAAVGRRFRFTGDTTTTEVIGVAANTVWMSPANRGEPFIYYPLGQSSASQLILHVRAAGAPGALVRPVRDLVAGLDDDLPLYDVRPLREHLDGGRAFFFLRLAALLAAALGAIALALGAVGLYGLLAFGVEQRRREIGVRLALGADGAGVRRTVIGGGLRLVALGLVLGLPLALVAARAVRGLVLAVAPGDPVAPAAGVATLVAVGLAATWLPARRAARVDPMTALRCE